MHVQSSVSPFDAILYETMESELVTLAGNFPLKMLQSATKSLYVEIEVRFLIRILSVFGLPCTTSTTTISIIFMNQSDASGYIYN